MGDAGVGLFELFGLLGYPGCGVVGVAGAVFLFAGSVLLLGGVLGDCVLRRLFWRFVEIVSRGTSVFLVAFTDFSVLFGSFFPLRTESVWADAIAKNSNAQSVKMDRFIVVSFK